MEKKSGDYEMAEKLRVVISRLVKILRARVKGEEALSLTERSTLAEVYLAQEALPGALAAAEKVTGQSMSQILNKLERLGLIRRTPSREDKRKVIITATVAGKKYVEKNRHAKLEWLAHALADKTSRKEKEILSRAITILTHLVDSQ